jgi:hypothetical protein
MKLSFLIGMVFLAAIARPAVPQQAPEPLKKDQIMDLVKAGMDSSALVKLIQNATSAHQSQPRYLAPDRDGKPNEWYKSGARGYLPVQVAART